MIEALLHGKLSCEQENMEDILTSNVFSMFQYTQPEAGLFPFLAQARTINDNYRPVANLSCSGQSQKMTVEYEFWPRWDHCEPDVVLTIRNGVDSTFCVAIEAKYFSGKSSRASTTEDIDDDEEAEELSLARSAEVEKSARLPQDQLAKEWSDLVEESDKRHAQPVLIYLTADLQCPKEEIESSIDDFGKPPVVYPRPTICWLSWRELPKLFRNHPNRLLSDVARLADRMRLTFFEGIESVSPIQIDWFFQDWRFDVTPITCSWRFEP